MKFPNSRSLAAGLLALSLAASTGCGFFGSGRDTVEAFDTPAQVLATQAEQSYNDGDYDDAAELYQQLKDRFPYSRYALLADLRVGDAYYQSDRFDEAALAYEDFIRLHPKNEGVPYAMYQMAMVFHAQMLTADRDPTMARKAADAFEKLIKAYPENEYAAKAKPRLVEAVTRQAEHDMLVGKFYYNTSKYRAAATRFKKVLTAYPDVGMYPDAMELLAKCETYLAQNPAPVREGEDINRTDTMGLESIVNNAGAPGGD